MPLFKKICLLVIPLVLIIGINVFYNPETKNTINFKKQSAYFIGSSRVRYEINPKLLNQNNNPIYNVGITASTFFHNIILAEHLIKENEPKELFIELSPAFFTLREEQKLLNVNPFSTFKHLIRFNSIHLKEAIDISENIIFEKLSFKDKLKNLLFPINKNAPQEVNSLIGYISNSSNNYKSNDSFLQIKDLESRYDIDISDYNYLIFYITQLAEKHKVKIRFFLPLTFNRQEERITVSTVYQSIPDNLKVRYTSEFLKKISFSENLLDKNHFNCKGAKIMTDYFNQLYFK